MNGYAMSTVFLSIAYIWWIHKDRDTYQSKRRPPGRFVACLAQESTSQDQVAHWQSPKRGQRSDFNATSAGPKYFMAIIKLYCNCSGSTHQFGKRGIGHIREELRVVFRRRLTEGILLLPLRKLLCCYHSSNLALPCHEDQSRPHWPMACLSEKLVFQEHDCRFRRAQVCALQTRFQRFPRN